MIDLKEIPRSEIFTGNIIGIRCQKDVVPVCTAKDGFVEYIDFYGICVSQVSVQQPNAVLLRVAPSFYAPIDRIRHLNVFTNPTFRFRCTLSRIISTGLILSTSSESVLPCGEFVDPSTLCPYDGSEKTYTLQKLKQEVQRRG